MLECPRCHHKVKPDAVTCPKCNNQLKAFGHPGIDLYQATDRGWLCDRCIYHEDDSCNFPQRPYAKSCTLFHDRSVPLFEETITLKKGGIRGFKTWCFRNRGLIAIAVLILISVVLVL
ncbi:MAG: zinc ribbon domain-containing protein [Pleurocapsa sp.]